MKAEALLNRGTQHLLKATETCGPQADIQHPTWFVYFELRLVGTEAEPSAGAQEVNRH